MHPGDDRIDGHGELMLRRAVEERCIVAQVEPTRPGERREEASDPAELAEAFPHGRITGDYNSAARRARASRSRTPFASPGSFPEKKAEAMPTYSLIVTRGGESGRRARSYAPAS